MSRSQKVTKNAIIYLRLVVARSERKCIALYYLTNYSPIIKDASKKCRESRSNFLATFTGRDFLCSLHFCATKVYIMKFAHSTQQYLLTDCIFKLCQIQKLTTVKRTFF